jgi:photosystem II stability/assembly factor-like uncharacterized protein
MLRVSLFLAACCAGLPATAGAAPAAAAVDAWKRPALTARHPARAVTQSAAQAGERLVAVGERGLVLLSDDGGKRWRQAPSPVSVTLTTVRFADARHGVAVGHAGVVLSTADGGDSWTLRLDGRRLAQLARQDAQRSGDAAALKAAEHLVTDGPDKPFLDVLVWDATHWLAVGAYGLAFHTTDGGQTWQSWMGRLPNPRGLHVYSARRLGSTLLLAGELGLVLRSDNNGASFLPLATPYTGSWFTAELPSAGEIVLAGLRGNVWRSNDGGARWTQIATPMAAAITASALGADGLFLTNQAGFVLRLQGDALHPVNAQPLSPLTGLVTLPAAAGAPGPRLLTLGLTGPLLLPDAASTPGASR